MTKEKHKIERSPKEGDYTLLCFKPKFLQCCNNANGFLVMYCIFGIIAGAMIGGVTNTNISTLERRFGLDSSQSAFVVVSYDIAFCVVTAFVTYFGAKSSIPRWVGVGAGLFGTGALIYALPHFTSPLYNHGSTLVSDVCEMNQTKCDSPALDESYNLYVLLLGQVLMGLGATPLYTLGIAYIEDSVAKHKAPVYIGIANACSLFGPVIGFTCGGVLLTQFYVDFESVNVSSLGLSSSHPRWVGAWWIAPLIMAVLSWSIVIPFIGFPKQLPGTAKNRAERHSEVHTSCNGQVAEKSNYDNALKNFPHAVSTLLKNPVYVIFILAGCASGGTVSGATSFLAKFVQNEFHRSAGEAAILSGAVLVPAAAAGHLFGGVLISRFKWKTSKIICYSAVCCFIVASLSPAMLLNCDNAMLAGVTSNYRIGKPPPMQRSLTASCNTNCSCQEEFYKPSCGVDMLTYFSPCHAGCMTEHGNLTFSNCVCVEENMLSSHKNTESLAASVTPGVCYQSCTNIYVFIPLIFLLTFFIFQSHTAATVATFRVVPESLRAFGVGLAWLFFRALGTIPGPIMFGKFVDESCILWQTRQCDSGRGSCWIYDSRRMAITFLLLTLVGNLLAGLFFVIAWIVYQPPQDVVPDSDAKDDVSKESQSCDNRGFDDSNDL